MKTRRGGKGASRAIALAIVITSGGAPGVWADPLAMILEHRAANAGVSQSQGCGKQPAPAPATIEVDDRSRRLIVVVPEPYDPAVPRALVVAFHGRTSPAAKVRRYYDLEGHASRPTLFVYPSGLPAGPARMTWSSDDDPAEELRDYRLFDAVVRRMDELYCLDRTRIFAVGHSLGAWFANSLACARGDVLRAVGTVAGGISASSCRGRPSAILLHHPLDQLVPYERGREALAALLQEPQPVRHAEIVTHAGFDCMRFGVEDRLILFCPHGETRTGSGRIYPHQWPERAGEAIMQFFEVLP